MVVSQANGDWKVREDKLKPYYENLERLIPQLQIVTFTHVPRLKNRFADALATLASMVEIPVGVKLRPIMIEQRSKPVDEYIMAVDEPDDGLPWYHDIWNFIEEGDKQERPGLPSKVGFIIHNLWRKVVSKVALWNT